MRYHTCPQPFEKCFNSPREAQGLRASLAWSFSILSATEDVASVDLVFPQYYNFHASDLSVGLIFLT